MTTAVITPDALAHLPAEYADLIPFLKPAELNDLLRLVNGLSLPPIPLRDYIPLAWNVIEPTVPYKHNWHIDAIIEHLEAVTWGQIKNLIINIPPRHMKSILVAVIWPTWVWTFRPGSQWLTFSYGRELATRDSVRSRRIINSEFYRKEFGDVFKLSGDQNLKTRYENDRGGHRIALGVGASTGEGGDFIVGDDLLSIDDRYSDVKRGRVNSFWSTTVATRGNTEKAASVIICQRLHADDIVGHLKEKEKEGGERYEQLIIPAEYEGGHPPTAIGWTDPRKERGDLLWPGRFNAAFIRQLKIKLGEEQTAAQLQQIPFASDGNIFKKSWLKFWMPMGLNLPPVKLLMGDGTFAEFETITLPPTFTESIQSWDMSFKKTDSGSRVAGQVWSRTESQFFLIHFVEKRMSFTDSITAVETMTDGHPYTVAKLVEEKANGAAVIDMLKLKIPGLIPFNPQGDKVTRAHAVTPYFEAGNVYLPHPAINNQTNELIGQLVAFPNWPIDDSVDALSQALIYFTPKLEEKHRAGTWGRR